MTSQSSPFRNTLFKSATSSDQPEPVGTAARVRHTWPGFDSRIFDSTPVKPSFHRARGRICRRESGPGNGRPCILAHRAEIYHVEQEQPLSTHRQCRLRHNSGASLTRISHQILSTSWNSDSRRDLARSRILNWLSLRLRIRSAENPLWKTTHPTLRGTLVIDRGIPTPEVSQHGWKQPCHE